MTPPLITPALLATPGIAGRDARTGVGYGWADPTGWAPLLVKAAAAHGIAERADTAAWLACIGNESAGGRALTESLNYDAPALLRQWPTRFTPAQAAALGRTPAHPADEHAIAERTYGARLGNGPIGCGDGWLFRGGGLMQHTGRDNYTAYARQIGWTRPVEELPALLHTRASAADSAGHFWRVSGCQAAARRGDVAGARRIANGGEIGMGNFLANYAVALRVLTLAGASQQPAVQTTFRPAVREETADELMARWPNPS